MIEYLKRAVATSMQCIRIKRVETYTLSLSPTEARYILPDLPENFFFPTLNDDNNDDDDTYSYTHTYTNIECINVVVFVVSTVKPKQKQQYIPIISEK